MTHPIVAIVGLGYIGLPLAVEFGKKFETLGFDFSEAKIAHYKNYCDPTGEVSTADLQAATQLSVSSDPSSIGKADVIIVAVPTPVDEAHIPDFSPLLEQHSGMRWACSPRPQAGEGLGEGGTFHVG